MTGNKEAQQAPAKMVAPGYPAIETVRQIDVTGWEPAAVFSPAVASVENSAEEAR